MLKSDIDAAKVKRCSMSYPATPAMNLSLSGELEQH